VCLLLRLHAVHGAAGKVSSKRHVTMTCNNTHGCATDTEADSVSSGEQAGALAGPAAGTGTGGSSSSGGQDAGSSGDDQEDADSGLPPHCFAL